MRMTFDKKTPRHEALMRIVNCHTGRKHGHRKGPGRIGAEQKAKQVQSAKAQKARRSKFLKRARAYWAGESETHP